MSGDKVRDALAAKIKDAYYHGRDHGGTMHTCADDAADAILASDVLATIKADAWDEGARAAATELAPNGAAWLRKNNPYRTDQEPCAEFGSHPRGGHADAVRER